MVSGGYREGMTDALSAEAHRGTRGEECVDRAGEHLRGVESIFTFAADREWLDKLRLSLGASRQTWHLE